MAERRSLAGIILIFLFIIGDIITGVASTHAPATPFALSFAQDFQGGIHTPGGACTQFDSGTAFNESGIWFQLTAKTSMILFWLTVVLADNLTNSGVTTAIFQNSTVLGQNIGCGLPTTGAGQISSAPYVSPPNANAQFTTTYSFAWTNAIAGTTYTFFLAVASSIAHAKIVVVAKLSQAIKTNLIGQAI